LHVKTSVLTQDNKKLSKQPFFIEFVENKKINFYKFLNLPALSKLILKAKIKKTA